MDIQFIDHAGINVKDLERSAQWYQRVLGLESIHKWKTTWMVGRDKIRLGLFLRTAATPVEDLDNRIAITHLAFVTDADGFLAAQAELGSLGISFEGPEDSGIALSIFFKDPDGHELEITTYHPQPQFKQSNEVSHAACGRS